MYDLERCFLDALFQATVQLLVPCEHLLDFIGHFVKVGGQLPPFIHPFHRDSLNIFSSLEFVDGVNNDAQWPRDQPTVTDEQNQQNGQQKATGTDDQQMLGTSEDFCVGLGKDNDADHNFCVFPLVRPGWVKQAQRGTTVSIQFNILRL